MSLLVIVVLVVGVYCLVELVLKHREKMALIAKGQNPNDDNEGEE